MPRPPTIADIAGRLRLAPTTVAAALRGEARISLTTRERVAQAASEIGYRRNLAASILGSRRGKHGGRALSVALVVQLAGRNFGPYEKPLREYFGAQGWLFHAVNLMQEKRIESVVRSLEHRGVDALILGATSPSDDRIPEFPWERFAVVSVIRQRVEEGFDTVRVNHFNSVMRLVRAIFTRGYRRIGILHRAHTPVLEEDDARLAAFLLLQHRRDDHTPEVHLFDLPFSTPAAMAASSARALGAWLRQHQIEVLVGFNSGDQDIVREAGLRIPADLAFAALHVYLREQPVVAGLQAPAEVVAGLASVRLEQKIKLGERGRSRHPVETVMTPDFFDGTTLPARDRRTG